MLSKRDRKALALLEAGGAADALEALECFTGYLEFRLAQRGMEVGSAPTSHVANARAVLERIAAERELYSSAAAIAADSAGWVRHEDDFSRAESIASAQAEHADERERAAELVSERKRAADAERAAAARLFPLTAARRAELEAERERADDAARERVEALERAGKLRKFPPEPTCDGCQRPEWECSAAPCADVIADRAGEWELAAESSAPQTEAEEHAQLMRRKDT